MLLLDIRDSKSHIYTQVNLTNENSTLSRTIKHSLMSFFFFFNVIKTPLTTSAGLETVTYVSVTSKRQESKISTHLLSFSNPTHFF